MLLAGHFKNSSFGIVKLLHHNSFDIRCDKGRCVVWIYFPRKEKTNRSRATRLVKAKLLVVGWEFPGLV